MCVYGSYRYRYARLKAEASRPFAAKAAGDGIGGPGFVPHGPQYAGEFRIDGGKKARRRVSAEFRVPKGAQAHGTAAAVDGQDIFLPCQKGRNPFTVFQK
jgi:hypothetical protein